MEKDKLFIENQELQTQIKTQNEKISKIEKENTLLKENISKLYKTSLTEARKKTNMITQLRRQNNDLVFRRNAKHLNGLKRYNEDENPEQNKRFKYDQSNPKYIKPPEPTDPPPESPDCINRSPELSKKIAKSRDKNPKRDPSPESPRTSPSRESSKRVDKNRTEKSRRDYKEKDRSNDRNRNRYRDDSRDRSRYRHGYGRDNPRRRYDYSKDTRAASVSRTIHKSGAKNRERRARAPSKSNFEFAVPFSHEKRHEKRKKSPKKRDRSRPNNSEANKPNGRKNHERFFKNESDEVGKARFSSSSPEPFINKVS